MKTILLTLTIISFLACDRYKNNPIVDTRSVKYHVYCSRKGFDFAFVNAAGQINHRVLNDTTDWDTTFINNANNDQLHLEAKAHVVFSYLSVSILYNKRIPAASNTDHQGGNPIWTETSASLDFTVSKEWAKYVQEFGSISGTP
jgi:hypothetical protein